MDRQKQPSIGILFEQFAAYHADRCEAAAARLAGRYRVVAVEVATRSAVYAWEPSGTLAGAEKVTLFAGRGFEEIGWTARLRSAWSALRRCRYVFVGVAYSRPDIIALSWLLRLAGTRVVMMTESKFDDAPRRLSRELFKRVILLAYHAAMVGGRRQGEYARLLGFTRRPVVPGYDGVGLDRIRGEAAGAGEGIPWEQRPFVYVGRFVEKKNLPGLLRGYARYVQLQGGEARRLRLVGDGPLRHELERLAGELGVIHLVEWTGFLAAAAVSRQLATGLALCLVSTEEQWGLVVNEALALGLPAIVSSPVGARDALVRSGLNGYVVEPYDSEQLAQGMLELAGDRGVWKRMAEHSRARAWLGDSERFADAVEVLTCGSQAQAAAAAERIATFEQAIGGR